MKDSMPESSMFGSEVSGSLDKSKENFLWKVYRHPSKVVSYYMTEMETNECLVIAPSEITAKGIALLECPSLLDIPHVTKKDIMVERVDFTKARLLM